MKKILKNSLLVLMLILSLQEGVKAQDAATLSVSCTIPAIPGVNAPALIEEETIKEKSDILIRQGAEKQEERKESHPAMIQEDSEKSASFGGKAGLIVVKTVYSR